MATGSAGGIRAAKAFVEMYVNNDGLQRGLKSAESRLRSFQAKIAGIGSGLVGAGAGVSIPIGFGAKEFATFEQSMARVSTMMEEPQKHMDGFAKGVKQMALESGKNINELADGLKEILSASVAPGDALGMLNNAQRMAVAADTTIGQSVFTLIGIMNSYGMTAAETGRISDVLFESVKWGTMTISGLSDAIGTVAPMANAAGMKLEDLMAVMSTLTRAGLSADEAGVRVNAMLKQMPREMKNALDVAKHFEGMELADINTMIPEIRAAQGFAILGNNVKGLARDMAMMRDSQGATEQAFQKMANTLMQWFNRAKEGLRQVGIAAGAALGPGLKHYGDAALNTMRLLADAISRNSGALVKFVKVVAGITAVGLALLFVSKMAGLLVFAINILQVLTNAWIAIPAAVAGGVLYMTGGFTELKRISVETMDGVKAALAGGDVLTAVKIFWTGVKIAWTEGVSTIETYWNGAVVAMAKSDNWIYFMTSQYGIVGSLQKLWWGAVRNIKDAWASLVAGSQKVMMKYTPYGMIASAIIPGDQQKEIDDELAMNAGQNLADMQAKQSAFDQARLEALKKLKDANDALDNAAAADIIKRETELMKLKNEMGSLLREANKPRVPVAAGAPGATGTPYAGPNTSAIARQISEARLAFGVGRGFGWNAGGANAKSKELEVAEESLGQLRKIATNTQNGTLAWSV